MSAAVSGGAVRRRERLDRLDGRYRLCGRLGGPCAYCGEVSSHLDHVPPLAVLDSGTVADGVPLLKVPACAECNLALGSKRLLTLRVRARARAIQLAGVAGVQLWDAALVRAAPRERRRMLDARERLARRAAFAVRASAEADAMVCRTCPDRSACRLREFVR